MKIAYDAKRFFQNASGLGNYSRDLVRIQSELFPENEYLLLNKKATERGRGILQHPNVIYLPTSKGTFARQLEMGKDAQNNDADIFHGLSGELPLKWTSKPIKKIVTIHDLIFMKFPKYYSFFDRKIHFWKFKKAAREADHIIAISQQTKQDIIEYLNVPEDKISVIYQGCHPAFKKSYLESQLKAISEKFNLPQHFVLNVGTIEERKNLLSVVKALQGTDIPLIVIGKKTKYFSKVSKEITKSKVDVRFLENVSMEELAGIYKLADIFIYPSLYEGFGIPIIEALFSETCVITSNVSCLPEAGGPDSVYINPKNPEDIHAKINFLWNNESERKRRAEKGLLYAQNFTDEKIGRQINDLYLEIKSDLK